MLVNLTKSFIKFYLDYIIEDELERYCWRPSPRRIHKVKIKFRKLARRKIKEFINSSFKETYRFRIVTSELELRKLTNSIEPLELFIAQHGESYHAAESLENILEGRIRTVASDIIKDTYDRDGAHRKDN